MIGLMKKLKQTKIFLEKMMFIMNWILFGEIENAGYSQKLEGVVNDF